MPFSSVSQQSYLTDYNTYPIPPQEFSPALGPGNTSLPSSTNYTGSLCNTVFNLKSLSLLSKNHIILHLPVSLTSWPPYQPTRTFRSTEAHLLSTPAAHLRTTGDGALSVAAPRLWSSLPLVLRQCASPSTSKSLLIALLFTLAVPSDP